MTSEQKINRIREITRLLYNGFGEDISPEEQLQMIQATLNQGAQYIVKTGHYLLWVDDNDGIELQGPFNDRSRAVDEGYKREEHFDSMHWQAVTDPTIVFTQP